MRRGVLLVLAVLCSGCGGVQIGNVSFTCFYEDGLPIVFEQNDDESLNGITVLMAGRALRDGWGIWTGSGSMEATMFEEEGVLSFKVEFDVATGDDDDLLTLPLADGSSRSVPATCVKELPTTMVWVNAVFPGTFR